MYSAPQVLSSLVHTIGMKVTRKMKLTGLFVSGLILLTLFAGILAQKIGGNRITVKAGGIHVAAGGDLQKAIDMANPGDTILLEPGATFYGPVTLPSKKGDAWITIRTAAPDTSLPPEGTRITPAYSKYLPKIVSRGNGDPAIRTAAKAHHFKLIGLEIAQADKNALIYDLITLGESGSGQKSLDVVPHNIVIDRCYIHSFPDAPLKRGIALNSAHTTIINSYLEGFKTEGQDSQAICGWNGPGPFKIINNYLEGAGENIMFGGATPDIYNLVPSDIEIRKNHFFKPLKWKKSPWLVKNLFELKTARRVVVDGNIFENSWLNGQDGYAFVFTVRTNEGQTPAAVVADVQLTNNIIKHANNGLQISGFDGDGKGHGGFAGRITVRNNVFIDIGGKAWGGGGRFLVVTKTRDLVIDHNTVFHTGNIASAFGDPSPGFVFTNNILNHNEYGLIGDGQGPGISTLDAYFPGATMAGNIIAGAPESQYPSRNHYPSSLDRNIFTSMEGWNFNLSERCAYRKKATDGKDPGCDLNQIYSATGQRLVATGALFSNF
jgi:hypothetical protein